jgi:hypothetical protein
MDLPDEAIGEPEDLAGRDLSGRDMAGKDMASPGDMASTGASCNPASQTLGAAGGPDTCAYGEACDSATSKCKAVMNGSCLMVQGAPAWNTATKMAPVITKATAVLLSTTNSMTECANGDPAALVTVEFYAPQVLTTDTMALAFLPQVKFKKSQVAADPWFSGTFLRSPVPTNAKVGSFQVGINCGGAGGTVKTAGLYILDEGGRTSNAICVSW